MLNLLPPGVASPARILLVGRGLRGLCDGFVAIILPTYLLALGYSAAEIGVLGTATLFGSALLTLALGRWGHHFSSRRLLLAAAILMIATGLGFVGLSTFWLLLLAAFIGTINPSSGDVSVFLPLEHARLAQTARGEALAGLFARYAFVGYLCVAFGALAAGIPHMLTNTGLTEITALRLMFVIYALAGVAIFLLYRRLPAATSVPAGNPPSTNSAAGATPTPNAPLGASRAIVLRLAALFSIDAFAGGFTINALLAYWLARKFGLSLADAGLFFFWAGLASAVSQLAAPWVAQRIGLLNTMVFTHIPSSLFLILAALSPSVGLALALLLLRSLLSQMDVPTRNAFVMRVVTPAERTAAASFTAVPRSLAAAASPGIAGAMFAADWLAAPLIICGGLKIIYDVLIWRAFRRVQVG